MKKIILSAALAFVGFSAQALTCYDLATENDDLAGIQKLEAAVTGANADPAFGGVLKTVERMKKEKNFLTKVIIYRDLKEALVGLCAQHDLQISDAIARKNK